MATTVSLSLILPVFNVAPYLRQCLESLRVLDPAPLEVIAINDGSTDGSAEILDSYRERLPNLVVVHQKNAGVSVARNSGIELAVGEYLTFVDSDDYVEPGAYSVLTEPALVQPLDIVMQNGVYHFENGTPSLQIYPDAHDISLQTGQEWLRLHRQRFRYFHYAPLHIYRREFLSQYHLRFEPGLLHEDVLWCTRAILCAKRMRSFGNAIYHYRIRDRKALPENRQRDLEWLVRSSRHNAQGLSQLVKDLATDQDVRDLVGFDLVDGALSIFHLLEKMPDQRVARQTRRELADDGFYRLLWAHAQGWPQHRRILRNWLLAFLPH